jgi:hypothetical protein
MFFLEKALGVGVLSLIACGCAFAQYGGGATGGTGGTPSYGHGAAIGVAVGGAAAGGALLYLELRHRKQLQGCVAPDGKTLASNGGKRTYELTGAPVPGGQKVSLVGKRIRSGSGGDEFQVTSVKKEFGTCEQPNAKT